MTSGKDLVEDAQVLILSYDLLAKKIDMLVTMGFGVIILVSLYNIVKYHN